MGCACVTLSAVPGATTSRVLLGRELTRRREAVHVGRENAAQHIGRTRNHIGNIETGRNPPTDLDELRKLAVLYHVSADELAALEQLWHEANKETWFSRFGLAEWLARYVGLETDAAVVRSFQLENVHGLLQTEQYIRATYALEPQPQSERETNKRVITRLHRQQRLVGDNSLRLIAVMSQSALQRCARAGAVGHGEPGNCTSARPGRAWNCGCSRGTAGCTLGRTALSPCSASPISCCRTWSMRRNVTGGRLTETPSVVAKFTTLFEELRGQALTPDESVAMIAQLLDEHADTKG